MTLTRRRRSDGESTHREILRVAVDIASAEGLEGLTIGRLAGELDMSKSGLFAHFGSKEDLQVATVDAAGRLYAGLIWEPAAEAAPGLVRLLALLGSWMAFIERSSLRGGCFFTAASFEFDARPGRVRERVAHWMGRGQAALQREAITAVGDGHLVAGTDPDQLVFELYAFLGEAVWRGQLFEDQTCFMRARVAIRSRLSSALTSTGRVELDALGPVEETR